MALHEVDPTTVGNNSDYLRAMIDEFLESDMKMALVDLPEGANPDRWRTNFFRIINSKKANPEYKNIKTRIVDRKFYFIKK